MLDMVENDFNVVKSNDSSLLTVEEDNADIYDVSLSLMAEEFNYMEILEDD